MKSTICGYEIHPAASLFPLLDDVSLQRLVEDIQANGLKVPIVLAEGKILDGRNRLLACKKAGVAPRFADHDGNNPWRAVWSLNAERRQIEDKVRLALIGKRMVEGSDGWEQKQRRAKDEARAAMSEGGRKAGKGRASHEAHPKQRGDESKKAAARLAEEVGVSRATVERALELERKRPEAVDAIVRGEVEGHKILGEVKRAERVEKLAQIAKGNTSVTGVVTGELYPVIYADPPWRYEHIETESRAIENQYPTMDLLSICKLPIAEIATDDAILFLWATSPKLAEAMRVVDSWGFTYRTCMVWVKDKLGMGYYARQRHELLLIATRGNPPTPAPADRPDSVVEAARGAHSAKPDEFAALIERMYPGLPRVELFCRSPRAGWKVWGNQAA